MTIHFGRLALAAGAAISLGACTLNTGSPAAPQPTPVVVQQQPSMAAPPPSTVIVKPAY